MQLTGDEIERYARHIVLRDFGGIGQRRLKAASLLIVGLGGLGGPVLSYCTAAGIGRIGLCDPDVVSVSNLQRQPIYPTAAVGLPKVDAARGFAEALNPHVAIEPHSVALTEANASLVEGYDIIADCTDDPLARYVISDAAFHARRPLVSASVGRFDGSLTAFRPWETGPDGRPNPTYRCLFPTAPAEGALPGCAETGVIGPAAGVIGSLQATAIVKDLIGLGSGLVGRLLLFDGRDMRFETLSYDWDPRNPLTGSAAG